MSASIPRSQVQIALRTMASKAREARDDYRRELAACHDQGLLADGKRPPSLTERFAHWTMADLMLHMAVTELLFSGRNTRRVDQYVSDLVNGERWPTEPAEEN